MSIVNCREGVLSDVGVIVGFQLAMALETEGLQLDLATCRKGVEAVFANSYRGKYFVAEVADEIVGGLLIVPEWSDWRNGEVWWIHSVYVKPEFRGQKIYTHLYQHVKSLVQADENLRGLRLYVDKRNSTAQKVYRQLGMSNEHYELYEWMKTF